MFVLIRKGAIGLAKPIMVYRYSEMEKAFRLIQHAKHMGKIVIKAHLDDMVPVLPRNLRRQPISSLVVQEVSVVP